MADDIHAVLLLATIPLAGYVIWRWGRFALDLHRIILGLFISSITGLVIWALFVPYSARPNPNIQVWLPMALGAAGYIVIESKWRAAAYFLVAMVVATAFSSHSRTLTTPVQAVGREGSDAAGKTTASVSSAAQPEQAWHSFFTGL